MSLIGYAHPTVFVITPEGQPAEIYGAQLGAIITALSGLATTLDQMLLAPNPEFDTTNLEAAIESLKAQLTTELQTAQALQQTGLAKSDSILTLLGTIQSTLNLIPADLQQQITELQTLGTEMNEVQGAIVTGFTDNITKLNAIQSVIQSEFDQTQAQLTSLENIASQIEANMARTSLTPVRREVIVDTSTIGKVVTIPAGAVSIDIEPIVLVGDGRYATMASSGSAFTIALDGSNIDYKQNGNYSAPFMSGGNVVYKYGSHVVTFPQADVLYQIAAVYEPADAPAAIAVVDGEPTAPV